MAASDLTTAIDSIEKTIRKITADEHVDPERLDALRRALMALREDSAESSGPVDDQHIGIT